MGIWGMVFLIVLASWAFVPLSPFVRVLDRAPGALREFNSGFMLLVF
jgi:hypothetical protein